MKFSKFLGATALASTIVLSAQAGAQTRQTPTPDRLVTGDDTAVEETTSAQGGEQSGGDNVIVTGSRIRRNQYNTADPVQVVSREEAVQSGFSTTTELLQSVALTGGSAQINNAFGGFVTAGGPGANTLSLRGFGTSRSLTLLNGRRLAPAGARGQVFSADLNVLPNAIIDRVEVLNGGASSIYGSDAIAGVVNLVTRTNVDGLQLEAQMNLPEVGAGRRERYSGVFGFSGDRFRFSGSLEYVRERALNYDDVKFTRCQTSYRKLDANSAPGTGDFIDPLTGQPKCYPTGVTGESGVTINTIATPNIAGGLVDRAPGVPAGYNGVCNRFRPDATATGAVPGYECVGGGTLPLGVRDTFPRSIGSNNLLTPREIYTGYAQASYELDALGSAEVYGELLVTRRKSSQSGNRQLSIDYAFGSPLIPANLRFGAPALPAQPTNPGVPVGVRVFADYGVYESRQDNDFVRALAGIRGDLFGGFRYDATIWQSWADSTYVSDLVLTDKLNQSLDVVASGTGFACRNPINGCVAAPALTPAVVGGQFPAAWINYISEPVTGTTSYKEFVASAFIDGPLFRLPGGMAQIALGVEYRKNSLDDTPSIDSQNGNVYNFSSSSITRGSDNVKEAFGEIELPILRNRPFFHDLTVTASARYTDYRSYGDQWTYKVGGLFSPVRWASVRGSYGTSFRAPALSEQFLGATSGFQSAAGDPCNNLGAAGQNPVRVANCRSEGIPDGFQATNSIAVLQRGGAESGLQSEDATAWTVGGVLQPNFGRFGTLSLSADYFNIEVEGGVSQLGFGTILAQCYDDPDFRAESICGLVSRNPSNNALTVTTGYVNISTAVVNGWDFNARYAVDLGFARFRLQGAVTKFNNRYNRLVPTDPIDNNIGTLNNPEWTGTFNTGLSIENINFNYQVEWIDGTNSSADYIGLTQTARDTYVFEAKDYYIHTASVRFNLDKFGLTLGVRDLLNSKLPQISSGAYNRVGNVPLYSGYNFAGRTFFMNLQAGF